MTEQRTGTTDVWTCSHCGAEYRGSGGALTVCTVCGADRQRRKLRIEMATPYQPVESDFLEQVAMQVTEGLADRPGYHLFMNSIYQQGHRPEWRVIWDVRTEEALTVTVQVRDGGPTVGE